MELNYEFYQVLSKEYHRSLIYNLENTKVDDSTFEKQYLYDPNILKYNILDFI